MGRVLVARLDSMGDVLLAGPAVRAVANGRTPDGSGAEPAFSAATDWPSSLMM